MIPENIMDKIIHVPSEDEYMEELVEELTENNFVVTNFSKGGVFYTILRIAVHGLIQLKELGVRMVNSAFMAHCPDDLVEIRAADYGKARKEGTKAEGTVVITRDPCDTAFLIKKGHMFKSNADSYGNYLRYYVLEDTALPAMEAKSSVYVQAENIGTAYNVPAGSIRQSLTHITGCTEINNEEDWLAVEGTDEETIESLRKRCLNSRAENAVQTIDRKIKSVVDSVPGVFISNIDSQHPRGQGTVDIIVVGTQGSVGEQTLNEVREAIKPLISSYGDYLVKSASTQAVDFQVELYFDKEVSTEGYAEQAKYIISKMMEVEARESLNAVYLDDIITKVKTELPKCRKCKILLPEDDVTTAKDVVIVAGDVEVTVKNL